MQYELLKLLKCPITKTDLRFVLISEFEKSYSDAQVKEIKEGLLFSETGFVFPIVDGIPRMLLESMVDYANFLKRHLIDYQTIKEKIEKEFKGLLNYCILKNRKTKISFEFEWSFLNAEKQDRIWHDDTSKLSTVFMNEMGERGDYFKGKSVIDVGCGHGVMTTKIAQLSHLAVGVELSKAVENAYLRNQVKNAWYIQGDLQYLPFEEISFDVVYSSGVIHHTNNTELSLLLIEPLLKCGGKICLWLYHPQQKIIHKAILLLRKGTRRLPLKLAFILLTMFVFPITFLIKKIKRKNAPNYREEIIDLLDIFTPEFRFEIQQDLASTWLRHRNYTSIQITTVNQFGFSIVGNKRF
ncbi:MAG TPA: hypothetical protein DCL77_19125 [Prolixibacteraceae bacterium]|jgi:ubiquinone/menaquinone biosynthesis C-methylase UbiE/uncharacterized protein YbaR (Trm112 family)|nr:hypothetical protein [Prolixibacteraceae bacterium]